MSSFKNLLLFLIIALSMVLLFLLVFDGSQISFVEDIKDFIRGFQISSIEEEYIEKELVSPHDSDYRVLYELGDGDLMFVYNEEIWEDDYRFSIKYEIVNAYDRTIHVSDFYALSGDYLVDLGIDVEVSPGDIYHDKIEIYKRELPDDFVIDELELEFFIRDVEDAVGIWTGPLLMVFD